MGRGREAEARRQAVLDALPALAAIVRAVHAAMVLLVEPVRLSRRHDEVVHALAELRIFLVVGQEVGACALVARLPVLSAVGRMEDAGGRDADPDPVLVLWVRDERM